MTDRNLNNLQSSVAAPSREMLYEQCKGIATHPNILTFFIEELARTGFVGEERALKLLYLALSSRFSDMPVSAVLKGPSSAGKSYNAEQTLKFFPSEAYYALSAMSEKALAYSTEPLRHRFLVVFEAAGMKGEFASYLIRSLLSEGKINYETVESTVDGLRPKRISREGPTGLLTTTTEVMLHPENETRLLSIPVNDSPEQTRRIMRSMMGDWEGAAQSIDYRPWHAFQQWIGLDSPNVVIPFGVQLAEKMNASAVRLRRDMRKLKVLIETHVLLHQMSRCRDDKGRIVATIEDYSAIFHLIADLLAEAAERSVSLTIRETVCGVRDLQQQLPGDVPVSLTRLAGQLHLDKAPACRRVAEAKEKGYLVDEETRRGYPSRLRIGDPLPEEQSVLPDPSEIQ